MKKLAVLFAAMIIISGVYAISFDSGDKLAGSDVKQLPVEAQSFIKKHFESTDVSYIKINKDFLWKTYDVKLANGFKLEFDNKGKCLKIDGKKKEIPDAVVPEAIREYVTKNYPKSNIVSIRIAQKGYKIELSSNLDLKFNRKFELIAFDS